VGRAFRRPSGARGIGQVRRRRLRSMTISTRTTRGRWDSWQRKARTIARGLLGRRDPPDRKTKKKKKTLACAFQTPNDPLGNSMMRWQGVAWKKRSGPFLRKKGGTCCVAEVLRCMGPERREFFVVCVEVFCSTVDGTRDAMDH